MKKEYHILFTGVGRRVELMQAFRQAALRMGINLKIYGADMTETAPALAYCDCTRIVCGMREKNYILQLVEICKEDKIDLLIPTIDTDLLILSKNKSSFEDVGTRVMVSQFEMIEVCRDKRFTADFFESCGLTAPRTYDDVEKYVDVYPCFIKPKDGSSSINAYKVNDVNELKTYAEQIEEYIVQPFIEGKEYTVDILCDFEGNPIYIVPRQRLAVRSGEVLKTRIDLDETIIKESKKVIEKFKPCGPITVQLIRQDTTGQNYYIEINPRFGGGAPLSMKAGADSAEAILKLLQGDVIDYQGGGINDKAVYSRFDQSVCVESGETKSEIKGIIFDLDDTLYSEKEYVKSGYHAVAEWLGDVGVEEKLWQYFEEGKNAIDEILYEKNILDKKEECLNIYRKHMPNITLYAGVEEMIKELLYAGIKVGIITDGRIEGQRNKIKALGLEGFIEDIIITDELGGEQFRKPNDIAFRIMQCRWKIPFQNMVYVGDNLVKDFQAPKQLGMESIYVNNLDGLYFSMNKEKSINMISVENVSDVLLKVNIRNV